MSLNTLATFSKAFTLALLDSERTDQLLIAEEISSVGRMDKLVALMEASDEGRAILAERPRITTRHVDFGALRALPIGTLGRTYVDHLHAYGLDPDALDVPVTRGRSEIANYLLARTRDTHDIWHTVLGLGAEGQQEVLVHTFQWPQLAMPYSMLVLVFGALKHVLGERRWPLLRHTLRDAWKAGAAAAPLLPVYWERHWETPIDELRRRLGVRPAVEWRGYAAAA